jgi:hypothetical protein
METPVSYYEISGAIHLHSNFSDGSLPIPDVARIAGEKGLDFLLFSDHNTLAPKRNGLEKWYNQVLVIIGCELNDPEDRNHYLAFRIDQEIPKGLSAAEYVDRVYKMGGFGIIAHPAEKRNFSDAYPPYPWTAWDLDRFDAIEIWNQLSEWIEGMTRRNFPIRILHPLKSIRFPVWETLERWDQFNKSRRVVGVGGIDVHAYKYKLFGFIPLEIYPYKVQFRSIRTHLLIRKPFRDDSNQLPFPEAEEEIFNALSEGRCFVTNHSVGNGKGFQFWANNEKGVHPMGSRLRKSKTVTFRIHAPLPGVIRWLQNGSEIMRTRGQEMTYTTDQPGVYRVEIFRKGRGWIYSNPIVITEKSAV